MFTFKCDLLIRTRRRLLDIKVMLEDRTSDSTLSSTARGSGLGNRRQQEVGDFRIPSAAVHLDNV